MNPLFERVSRRRCLATAGVSLALPFLESLSPIGKLAYADSRSPTSQDLGPASTAKRLVCMGVSLSMYPDEWNPKETGRDYTVPKLIEPLADLREDFTLISNADHPGVTGGHKGAAAFLSGVYRPERVGQSIIIRNRITLDQLVAQSIGNETRFQSMQFAAAGVGAVGVGDTLSWNEKGVPLPCLSDPLAIYERLFVNDPNPERTAQAMKSGRSVLDFINADAKLLAKDLSKPDRQRMDQYTSSVRDVEKRISRQLEWLKTPKPSVPAITDRATSYHSNLDLILELAALALQTDSTRVISVGMPGKGMTIKIDGRQINDYHGQSHHGQDPDVVRQLVEIERMHTTSLAKFLNRLKSTPTIEGNLLDCTQVLFGSGLGSGSSHSNRDLPVLLAGGGLKHGSHIKLGEGTPLCNVFVTMLQRLGIDADSFAGSTGNVNEWIG